MAFQFSSRATRTKHQSLFTLPTIHILLVALFAILIANLAAFNLAFAQSVAPEAIPDKPVRTAALVRPNDMNSGGLLLPSKRPGFYVEAPRLATDVKIDITGPIARTIVTQRFENPTEGWLEGIYVFPLPENSAVDTLKMRIGERFIEGEIKKREEARKIYEKAKREGKKAALLEQQRPNIFTNAVANIGPGETIVVQIEYQQTIRQDNGVFSLRFPMVVAPRYNPQPIVQSVDFKQGENGWGTVDPVPDRDKITSPVLDPAKNAKINPVNLRVKLAAGFELGEVKSSYHEIASREIDASTRSLRLKNESVPADRDFQLIWKPNGKAHSAALFHEEINGEDYVLLFLTPPTVRAQNLPKKNRETIFVIDNSGSMAGESIVQAKLALADALSRLSRDDKFNIVRFDDTQEILFEKAVTADKENIGVALRFVKQLQAEGGTQMLPALQMALVDHNAGDTKRVRQVVFITDGAIGNEKQLFDAIAAKRGRSRVFTIGIGSAPNSFFMTRAAEMGRGTFTHIGATSEVKDQMATFFAKLENPVLTGLTAKFDGDELIDLSPNPLPDLYMGEPVVLAAKLKGHSGSLTLTGDYVNQPWQADIKLADAAKGSGIGKLWARRKIASLEASLSRGTDPKSTDAQIENVALNHHLVSRLTSLVAVEVKTSRPEGEPLATTKVPHNLPKGWEFDKVFGDSEEAMPTLQRTRALNSRGLLQVAQLAAPAPTPKAAQLVAQKAKRAVQLPQTATPAERNIILGMLLLILASALVMLSRMGRHVRAVGDNHRKVLSRREFARLP